MLNIADCGRAVVMIGEKFTGVDSDSAKVLIEKIKDGTVETE